MLPPMKKLLLTEQPHAAAFNGLGFFEQGASHPSQSAIRWIGTESGLPNAPDIWSTAAQTNDYSGTGSSDLVSQPPSINQQCSCCCSTVLFWVSQFKCRAIITNWQETQHQACLHLQAVTPSCRCTRAPNSTNAWILHLQLTSLSLASGPSMTWRVRQDGGWFWQNTSVRSLSDLQLVYHQTVGRNCVLELVL